MFYVKRHSVSVVRGSSMKRLGSEQVQDSSCESMAPLSSATKFVTVAIFEMEGKTILQPLINEHDAKITQELFQSETLEVWLSNGKQGYSDYDVDILKYRQVPQPFTKCSKIGDKVCLKNLFESIDSCAKCPLCDETGRVVKR